MLRASAFSAGTLLGNSCGNAVLTYELIEEEESVETVTLQIELPIAE